MVESAVLAGYQGIYVDRFGYKDGAAGLEGSLRALLETTPLESSDRRLAFYDLQPYARRFRTLFTDNNWQQAREAVLYPLGYAFEGCSGTEGTEANNWRWCGKRAALDLKNHSAHPHTMVLQGQLLGGSGDNVHIRVDGPGFQDNLSVPQNGSHYYRRINVKPGRTLLHFASDGKQYLFPGDPRTLIMRMDNFRITMASFPEVDALWKSGCYGQEHDSLNSWRWCSNSAELVLANRDSTTLAVPISFEALGGSVGQSDLTIQGPGFIDHKTLSESGSSYQRTVILPPGESKVLLNTNAKRVEPTADARVLVFRVMNFRIQNPEFEEHPLQIQ